MPGRSYFNIKKLILSLLILSGLTVSLYSQDKQISGVINVYKRVVAIGPGTDNVTLNNVDSIITGDTVLLIQMKGAIINVPETSSYGSNQDFVGSPGSCEFLIVESVNPGTKKVIFTANNILKSYDTTGIVQLIKVPFYNSATVKADLTCQPWDSTKKTGGVLAMIVGRTLSLDANIDVTGKGFTGGAITSGVGICLESNSALYDKFSYPDSYNNSGYKGESQVIKVFLDVTNMPSYFPAYAKGKGNNFTGGGGGNGRFSGGGGGSNYGIGGKGGREVQTCTPTPGDGGIGGRQVKFTVFDGGIFLGSGGGSSTYETGTATPGSRGGGIIIIMCDTLKGKGNIIKADGATPTITASGNAGAGGGGGGGSVALYQQSFSTQLATSALTISANGGKGGNNNGQFGEGGGGGGGFVLTNNIPIPANVTNNVTGGLVGTRSGASTGGSGTIGESITTFAPALNGFLFNSIRSSVSQNQVDSVCSDMIPPKITGTKPVGGTLPYTYLWEKSYDKITWTALTNDADPTNYTPKIADAITPTPTDTVWLRRTITDSSIPIIDISNPVKITVHPKIQNNKIVADPDTICFNGDPQLLKQDVPDLVVPTTKYLLYSWQDSTVGVPWGTETGTVKEYDPSPSGGLTQDTWYRRTVKSGSCIDKGAMAKVTVLPKIINNAFSQLFDTVCFGGYTNLNTVAGPAGGLPTDYRYQWVYSTTGSAGSWNPVSGETNQTFDPDVLVPLNVGDHYYRRIIFSGEQNACKDSSVAALRKVWPVITNNTITANQTICSGSAPANLIGSIPLNGDGTYAYTWQDSTKSHTWIDIPGAINILSSDYQPNPLNDTTGYRRIVFSSACSDIGKSIIVNVHKPIANNVASLISGPGPDTTICSGAVPDSIMGSIPTGGTDISNDYAYLWESSTTSDIAGFSAAQGVNTKKSYKPGVLTQPTWFRRKVISGACSSESNPIRVIVLPTIQNNVLSSDQTVCYGTIPSQITGTPLTGGDVGNLTWIWQESSDGLIWTAATGIGNQQNYSPPSLTIPMKYMRIIHSGLSDCCIDTSNVVTIGIYPPLPTGTITNIADTTICGGSNVILKIHLTGTSQWKVTYKENSVDGPVNTITGADGTISVVPGSAAPLSTYTYSLGKVEDNNGCLATTLTLTGTKKADVHKTPVANAGRDTVVCGTKVTLNATPSIGSGTWYYPAAVIASTVNNPSVVVTIDPAFAGKSIAHTFIWEEVNWQCKNEDSVIITFDKQVSSNNAGKDIDTLYSFDNTVRMNANPLLTWESGVWTIVSGTSSIDSISDPKAQVRNLSSGLNTFLWTVTNGTCINEDLLNINVHAESIPQGFSPNNDNLNDTLIISGLYLQDQTAELKIVNGAGTEVFSTTNLGGQKWTNWDGKNSKGNDLPEGTYYYLLKVTSKITGQVFKRSGFIVLKRY